jgi:hypothetical protein
MHFQSVWAREGGARMLSHDSAALWLWQVRAGPPPLGSGSGEPVGRQWESMQGGKQ